LPEGNFGLSFFWRGKYNKNEKVKAVGKKRDSEERRKLKE
jgi:hypothetical protein